MAWTRLASPIIPTVSSIGERPTATTRAPAAAIATAIAWPMPLLAPVTTAVLFSRLKGLVEADTAYPPSREPFACLPRACPCRGRAQAQSEGGDGAERGGGSGIRTHGELAPTPVFKTGALNRSAIPPSPLYAANAAHDQGTWGFRCRTAKGRRAAPGRHGHKTAG